MRFVEFVLFMYVYDGAIRVGVCAIQFKRICNTSFQILFHLRLLNTI